MPYEVIDHTADTGIRVWAESPAELFMEAGRAIFELITDRDRLIYTETRNLYIEGIDRTDLFINWLRELLLIWNSDQFLVQATRILDITETRIKARAFIQPFDADRHVLYTDIKAVTYHCAEVIQTQGGWEATVIFDV
ncbi:MAG: archease [Desulfobacterales bacterium]